MSTLTDFLDSRHEDLASGRSGIRELHRAYAAFVTERDEVVLPEKAFNRRIEDLGYVKTKDVGSLIWTRSGAPGDDHVEAWLRDHLIPFGAKPPGMPGNFQFDDVDAPVRKLYDRYKADARASGAIPLGEREFGDLLAERGVKKEVRRDATYWLHASVRTRREHYRDLRRAELLHNAFPAWRVLAGLSDDSRHRAHEPLMTAGQQAWRDHDQSHDLTGCGKDHALPDLNVYSGTFHTDYAAWEDEHCRVSAHCPFTPECIEDIEARFDLLAGDLSGYETKAEAAARREAEELNRFAFFERQSDALYDDVLEEVGPSSTLLARMMSRGAREDD